LTLRHADISFICFHVYFSSFLPFITQMLRRVSLMRWLSDFHFFISFSAALTFIISFIYIIFQILLVHYFSYFSYYAISHFFFSFIISFIFIFCHFILRTLFILSLYFHYLHSHFISDISAYISHLFFSWHYFIFHFYIYTGFGFIYYHFLHMAFTFSWHMPFTLESIFPFLDMAIFISHVLHLLASLFLSIYFDIFIFFSRHYDFISFHDSFSIDIFDIFISCHLFLFLVWHFSIFILLSLDMLSALSIYILLYRERICYIITLAFILLFPLSLCHLLSFLSPSFSLFTWEPEYSLPSIGWWLAHYFWASYICLAYLLAFWAEIYVLNRSFLLNNIHEIIIYIFPFCSSYIYFSIFFFQIIFRECFLSLFHIIYIYMPFFYIIADIFIIFILSLHYFFFF